MRQSLTYRNKQVLVTGGLGFIGSNLAIRLVQEGAKVTVVDPVVDGCGGNPYNLEPVRDEVTCVGADISEAAEFQNVIASSDVIFNLAGEISHVHSMEFPERDMQINALAQLRFLLACKDHAPGVRVVYAGTRQVYGVPQYLPLDEFHPINPVDFNGIHKYAATMYHMMLSRTGHLDAVALRLTNVYGPRMALDIPCQGFLSTFFRKVLLGERLTIFGDGKQLRDPLYVDDAVEAFLQAGLAPALPSRTYNVGGPEALQLDRIAEMASRAGGCAPPVYHEFPEERRSIDIGSYHTDSTRIQTELGWTPKIGFEDGLRRTLEYYRAEMTHYLEPSGGEPTCHLPEHTGLQRRLTYSAV